MPKLLLPVLCILLWFLVRVKTNFLYCILHYIVFGPDMVLAGYCIPSLSLSKASVKCMNLQWKFSGREEFWVQSSPYLQFNHTTFDMCKLGNFSSFLIMSEVSHLLPKIHQWEVAFIINYKHFNKGYFVRRNEIVHFYQPKKTGKSP